MTDEAYLARNHAEFVAWCESGHAKRMTLEEAHEILDALRERAKRENLTREQARTFLLDAGIWLSVESESGEWSKRVRPIFLNLEGLLQKTRGPL
jgi:hypothetical protein